MNLYLKKRSFFTFFFLAEQNLNSRMGGRKATKWNINQKTIFLEYGLLSSFSFPFQFLKIFKVEWMWALSYLRTLSINHIYFTPVFTVVYLSRQHTPSIKGSVQRKLRPMLLYIIQKLFLRRRTAEHLNFSLLKGHLTIYIKPLQRSLHSPITFAGKCNSTL